jgi:hypothetical protein
LGVVDIHVTSFFDSWIYSTGGAVERTFSCVFNVRKVYVRRRLILTQNYDFIWYYAKQSTLSLKVPFID